MKTKLCIFTLYKKKMMYLFCLLLEKDLERLRKIERGGEIKRRDIPSTG